MVKKLDHIAIAVPDLMAAVATYENILGVHITEPQELPEHGVRIVFVHLSNSTIELMEPMDEDSPIAAFLQRNPNGGMHHLCIGDSDFSKTVEQIQQSGIRSLGTEKIGAHGNSVLFLHPKDCHGTLVELEAIKSKDE